MQQENLRTRYKRQVRRTVRKVEEEEEDDFDEKPTGPFTLEVDHSNVLSHALGKFFGKKEFTDFVFYAEQKPIYVHKIVVSQRRYL